MPKVSVIINCYNGEEFLAETLETVKNQTFKDYELIFWDNCSTDNTPNIVKTFDERLRYFRGVELIPLGQARNKALEQVEGEYIAFIDSDDLWDETKLEKEVKVMESDASIGMVLSNYKRFNMLSGETDIYNPNAEDKTMEFSEFVCTYDFCLSTFLIRKSALEDLQYYFDNRLKYAEEYEFFIRIARNWKAVYLKDALTTYRIHGNMNTLKLQDRMAAEYEITLDNLRKMEEDFDGKFPEIVKRISYLRDFSEAKCILPKGENKRVRKLMKPHWGYNVRAKCFYLVACMPGFLSKKIYKMFYRKRI